MWISQPPINQSVSVYLLVLVLVLVQETDVELAVGIGVETDLVIEAVAVHVVSTALGDDARTPAPGHVTDTMIDLDHLITRGIGDLDLDQGQGQEIGGDEMTMTLI